MKAEEQTLLNGILSTIFKLDPEQTSKLYNADGDLTDLSVVTNADAQRVAKFNTEKISQYNRGIKEGAQKIEKEIKDKYGESDLLGAELVDAIVLKQVEEAKVAGAKDITKHPDYIKLETSVDSKIKEREKEWKAKLDAKELEFKRSITFDKVKTKALAFLESSKAILPADATKAANWKATYLNELNGYNYLENEDGTFTILDKDGNALKDVHSNIRTFDEVIKECADKYFEYPAADQRSSSGNHSSSNAGQSAGEPKTKAEAFEKLKDPNITLEDRRKYDKMYNELKE